MQLSDHFTLEELTFSETAKRKGLHNQPSSEIVENLTRLALKLEEVRNIISKAVYVTSGYRSPIVNKLIGGSERSQHLIGCAADFVIHGMTPDEVYRTIIASGIEFDQLIREYDSWIHISIPNEEGIPPRMDKLIIDSRGTKAFS